MMASLVTRARQAQDKHARIFLMAKVMRHQRNGPEAACTVTHLQQAGFTLAEIEAYADDARAAIICKPSPLRFTSQNRLKGVLLAKRAHEIRSRYVEARLASVGGARG